MTLIDDLRPLVDDIRGIPGELGGAARTMHSVTLLSRSWDGTYSGDGTRTNSELAITVGSGQNPYVRWLNDDELAVAGLERGTIEVGPFTADFNARVWLDDILGENLSVGDGRFLVITGPKHATGAKYRITRISAEWALHYKIQAQPVDS